MRICVDPGHGGSDPGAVNPWTGAREKDITLRYALDLAAELEMGGARIIKTRQHDVFVSLDQRCGIANSGIIKNTGRSDLFISIHVNGHGNPTAKGWEIWTSPGPTNSDILATLIYNEVDAEYHDLHMRPDWSDGDPDKEGKLRVLTGTWMPAVLVELGFIRNAGDLANMLDPEWQWRMVCAIAKGVMRYARER